MWHAFQDTGKKDNLRCISRGITLRQSSQCLRIGDLEKERLRKVKLERKRERERSERAFSFLVLFSLMSSHEFQMEKPKTIYSLEICPQGKIGLIH